MILACLFTKSHPFVVASDRLLVFPICQLKSRATEADSLSPLCLVICLCFLEHFRVDLHEQFQSVVDHSMDRPVPVRFRVLEQCGEDNR